ncbi:MAG TPA: alpha/beta hydrolase [Gammaproteobacteria bacterium]|nr:alpha/beta hydrolase [Gammaproteobacteria bacterium]
MLRIAPRLPRLRIVRVLLRGPIRPAVPILPARLRRPLGPPLVLLALACILQGCGDGRTSRIGACSAPPGTSAFSFDSDGARLYGFIDEPPGPGPHPAVLLIHGEGRTDVTHGRGDFPTQRAALRAAGIAGVIWDRRGSGCSAGRFRGLADLFLRSDDVLAAAKALAERKDIDADRIGLWARGRGGWVAPMALTRSRTLAFMIVVGGPGLTPGHEAEYLVRKNLELAGVPDDRVHAAAAATRTAWQAMAEQKSYLVFQTAAAPLEEQPAFQSLLQAAPYLFPDPERYTALQESGVLDLSTEAFLPAVRVPVLAIWGSLDSVVDARTSREVYRKAFAAGRNPNLDTRVFERAGHDLCKARTGSIQEQQSRARCVPTPGYLDTVVEWLRTRGFAPSPAARSTAGAKQ